MTFTKQSKNFEFSLLFEIRVTLRLVAKIGSFMNTELWHCLKDGKIGQYLIE